MSIGSAVFAYIAAKARNKPLSLGDSAYREANQSWPGPAQGLGQKGSRGGMWEGVTLPSRQEHGKNSHIYKLKWCVLMHSR